MHATSHWHALYPTLHGHTDQVTRTLTLVNTHLSMNSWTQIPIKSCDIVALQFHGDYSTVRFINIYNDGNHGDVLRELNQYMRNPASRMCPGEPLHYVWMGDFNHHSPLWDEECNNHLFLWRALQATQPLINLLGSYHMKMALPKDVPTLEAKATKNLTCPDNVFCSTGLLEHFVTCNTEPAWWPIKTDHFPIISIIDITPSSKDFTPQPIYKETEWNDFRESLKVELGQIPDQKHTTTLTNSDRPLNTLIRLSTIAWKNMFRSPNHVQL